LPSTSKRKRRSGGWTAPYPRSRCPKRPDRLYRDPATGPADGCRQTPRGEANPGHDCFQETHREETHREETHREEVHPEDDHPKDDHPKDDHPKDDHPKDNHPKTTTARKL
jgi:hypothetical protein